MADALERRPIWTYLQQGRELDDEPLEVHMDDLEARARDFGVHSLDGFYRSRAFRAHRFEVDHKRRMIVKAL